MADKLKAYLQKKPSQLLLEKKLEHGLFQPKLSTRIFITKRLDAWSEMLRDIERADVDDLELRANESESHKAQKNAATLPCPTNNPQSPCNKFKKVQTYLKQKV